MNKNILFFVAVILSLTGCDDLIEPAIENNRGLEDAYSEPRFAQGLLLNGYARIPTNGTILSDMATDNAVSNDLSHDFSAIGTGQWAANNNPLDQWTNAKAAIQYLNITLAEVDSVTFSATPIVDRMFKDRFKGEAYGLRAMFMYYLLQAHGGVAGGSLLGVPIVQEPEDINSDFNQQRASFEDCMQQLYADIEVASDLLPIDYANIGDDSEVPDKYLAEGAAFDDYNRVFGDEARLLFSGRIARAVRAQAALMAASPAFSTGTTTTWEDVANYAAEVIDLNGGIGGLDANGVAWFNNASEIDGVGAGVNPPEILWRTDIGGVSSDLEEQNLPPTLFGEGLVNPTQNLVDAFPMANGYPIANPSSGYDAADPYTGRDPRLGQFIIVNGSLMGSNDAVINTAVDGGTIDGLNQRETSTRTGYYMRKLLRNDVSINPNAVNGQMHLNPRIRYTEIYLIYAEAANEAFGPTGTGGHAYSSEDVIRAIRQRAGLGTTGNDPYLDLARSNTEGMRELIQNERRLELSFEGFRFWDLRRWNKDLTSPALGVSIESGNHQIISVENRVFDSFMMYGPIPYSEILKFGEIEQNEGW